MTKNSPAKNTRRSSLSPRRKSPARSVRMAMSPRRKSPARSVRMAMSPRRKSPAHSKTVLLRKLLFAMEGASKSKTLYAGSNFYKTNTRANSKTKSDNSAHTVRVAHKLKPDESDYYANVFPNMSKEDREWLARQ
jgi:hypothetical protein